MASKPPQVLSRRTNGVLPVPASQIQQSETKENKGRDGGSRRGGRGRGHKDADKQNDAPKKAPKPKKEPEGEKLTIRRIPPGMTEAECMNILGGEWSVGQAKADWFSFAAGKLSLDPAKPSRPGRAYIHLVQKDLAVPFSDHVRNSTWEDAANSFNNSSLLSPPYVEFSIYKKVPNSKKRQDARQGTIDQDAEFMAFLEELANPVTPKDSIENDEEDLKADAKPTTTPLVEYIKEKKEKKAKDAASGKTSKHTRNNSGPSKGKGAKEEESTTNKKKTRETKSEKAEKTSKETVKILTKKDVAEQSPEAGAAATHATTVPSDGPKSRRAGIAAAARILQRDLGLSPGSAHRKARQDAAKADAGAKGTAQPDSGGGSASKEVIPRDESPAPSIAESSAGGSKRGETAAASKAPTRRGRGGKNPEKGKAVETSPSTSATPAPAPVKPVLLKKRPEGELAQTLESPTAATNEAAKREGSSVTTGHKGSAGKSQNQSKKTSGASADAKRAFVKHANASQGITEELLKSTLASFGEISFIEVDKRKGFAYVDFAEPKSLAEAMSASPIAVAQGAVQVLERKDKKPQQQQQQQSASASAGGASGASGAANGMEKNGGGSGGGGGGGRGRRGRGGGKGPTAAAGAGAARTSSAAPSSGG